MTPASGADPLRKWIVVAAFVALVLKVIIASSTFGTNDVESFYHFGRTLSQHGLHWTYTTEQLNPMVTHSGLRWFETHKTAFNHPPMVAYYLRLIYRLDHLPWFEQNKIAFPLLLRLPGILADLVVVLLLARWQMRLRLPSWLLMAFALSPISLMVSGFHGNTDPVMVMFLVIAALMCVRDAPVLCGLALALSCQIKIIPLLLFPIFAFFWFARGNSLRFALPFAVTGLLLCLEPLLWFPSVLVKNVLSYSSFWGSWGITYLLQLTGRPEFSVTTFHGLPAAEVIVMNTLKVFIIGAVLLIAWRRRHLTGEGLFRTIGIAWIVFFVFSPAIAPQYMVWIAPFVLVFSPWIGAAVILTSSLFLFCFYNVTSNGLPWYIAISTPTTNITVLPWSLWPWAAVIAALVALWVKAKRAQPDLRLLSLQTVERPVPA